MTDDVLSTEQSAYRGVGDMTDDVLSTVESAI
jgi:hypothetical protein